MTDACKREELLICLVARLLAGVRHVAIGALSPIPGAAALLTQAISTERVRVSFLQGRFNQFTDGGRELFDAAAQGRIDAFFLGGVQIDGQANINLVGPGPYPKTARRFSGSFGSALMYYVVPRVILFREEHSPRTLVRKVDFISAPGVSPPGVYRPGGPAALVTSLAHFSFDRSRAKFRLESVHPGHTAEEVREQTGFDFDAPSEVPATPAPEPDRLALLRGPIAARMAGLYPEFHARVFAAA
ncbi:MAG: CoA-transferase [Xanthobacteraceae bacterium]